MLIKFGILLTCLSLLVDHVSAYAEYMINDPYCQNRPVAVGATIMGVNAKSDTQGRVIVAKRAGISISSGSSYVSGETLSVTVSTYSNLNFAMVIEAKGASFQNGVACTAGGANSRVVASRSPSGQKFVGIDSSSGTATLQLPSAGSGDVTIVAGIAAGQGTVSITATFTLKDPANATPTTVPTMKPTSPSLSPIISPTNIPSVKPTSPSLSPVITPTAAPTPLQTRSPSKIPLKSPTRIPTASNKPNSTNKPTEKPNDDKPVSYPSYGLKPSHKPTTKKVPTAIPTIKPTSNDLWSSQGGNIQNTRHVVGSSITSSTLNLNNPTHSFLVGDSVSATPAIFGNYVIFPSFNGKLSAYNKVTKTLIWQKDIKAAYFPKLKVSTVVSRTTPAKYGSSFLIGIIGPAQVLKLDIATGNLLGRVILSSHIAALITMSGTVYKNKFFVGVSSREESMAADPSYTCCSFGGTFHAIDIPTMQISWTWYAIPPNLVGPSGFSGNALWGSSPSVDADSGLVFLASGNNYEVSDELNECLNTTAVSLWETSCNQKYGAENWFESVIALKIDTGSKVWARRLSSYDAWTVACLYGSSAVNCPSSPGPDSDFGMAPVISKMGGRKVLYVGQKNGIAHCLSLTDGSTIWATETSPGGTLGGLSWGISVDDSRVFVSVINYLHLPWTLKNGTVVYGGGWAALDKTTGAVLWTTANPANFDPSGGVTDSLSNGRAQTSWATGPAASVGDIVLVGSADRQCLLTQFRYRISEIRQRRICLRSQKE